MLNSCIVHFKEIEISLKLWEPRSDDFKIEYGSP